MALLKFLDHDKAYQALKAEYLIADPNHKKELAKEMKIFRNAIDLSEYGFKRISKKEEGAMQSTFPVIRCRRKRPESGKA